MTSSCAKLQKADPPVPHPEKLQPVSHSFEKNLRKATVAQCHLLIFFNLNDNTFIWIYTKIPFRYTLWYHIRRTHKYTSCSWKTISKSRGIKIKFLCTRMFNWSKHIYVNIHEDTIFNIYGGTEHEEPTNTHLAHKKQYQVKKNKN